MVQSGIFPQSSWNWKPRYFWSPDAVHCVWSEWKASLEAVYKCHQHKCRCCVICYSPFSPQPPYSLLPSYPHIPLSHFYSSFQIESILTTNIKQLTLSQYTFFNYLTSKITKTQQKSIKCLVNSRKNWNCCFIEMTPKYFSTNRFSVDSWKYAKQNIETHQITSSECC